MARRPPTLLLLASASALGALLVWFAAIHTTAGRALDARALQTFTSVDRPPLTPRISGIAGLADPWPFVGIGLALVALALLRRRWWMAALVPAILLAANGTTQLLKPALGDLRVVQVHDYYGTYGGSWPSGHATASMSLALCLVLVSGPRLRPLAALVGAGYAIAVGYALVVLSDHLPSDVVGGYLTAATFTLLGAAALSALEDREPAAASASDPPPLALSAPALAAYAAVLVALVGAALVVRRPETPLDALQHPTAVVVGVGIAALGLALTTGLARILRR
jgi:membrane-associated phospholipid phosphatase